MLTLPLKYFSLGKEDGKKTNSTHETRMGLTFNNMVGFLDFKIDYFLWISLYKKRFWHAFHAGVQLWNLQKSIWHSFYLLLFPRSFHWVDRPILLPHCVISPFSVSTEASVVKAGNTLWLTEESSKSMLVELFLISYSVKVPLIS